MKVVFLGCTDNYGFGFSANVTKIGYMAKGLIEAGADCSIHNGIIGAGEVEEDQTRDVNGIQVTTLKKRGNQLFSYVRNIRKTFRYLKQEKEKDGQNIIIITQCLYHILLTYYIMSNLLGYKLVAISHEWGPTLKSINKIKYALLCLYAKTFGCFCDGILPISEYIIERVKHFKKPYFKVPILAEFNEEEKQTLSKKNNTFVYCASVYYKRILYMLIDAHNIYVQNGGRINLTLVLNGPQHLQDDVQNYIDGIGLNGKVIIKTKLPYNNLLEEYRRGIALIIPLDPNYDQDKARFSQKIAEYLSTKSAILTNKVGEINFYFKDDEIITCEFNKESFANAFKWIELHPEECKTIGIKGFERGKKEFCYKTVGNKLNDFLESIA